MNGKCCRLRCDAPATHAVVIRFFSGRVKREETCEFHGRIAYAGMLAKPVTSSGSCDRLVAGGAAVAGVA